MASGRMSEEHKNRLNVNRVVLVDNMEPAGVLDHMHCLLGSPLVEEINAKSTRREKAERLLDTMHCRPDCECDALVTALNETNHKHVAELLDKTAGAQIVEIKFGV